MKTMGTLQTERMFCRSFKSFHPDFVRSSRQPKLREWSNQKQRRWAKNRLCRTCKIKRLYANLSPLGAFEAFQIGVAGNTLMSGKYSGCSRPWTTRDKAWQEASTRSCCIEAVDAWVKLSLTGRGEVADKNGVTEKGVSGFPASLDQVLQIEEAPLIGWGVTAFIIQQVWETSLGSGLEENKNFCITVLSLRYQQGS